MTSEEQIPERSNLWLEPKSTIEPSIRFFDPVTIAYSIFLAIFIFVLFYPMLSQFTFREAFFTPLVPFLINIIRGFGAGTNEALRIIYTFSFIVCAEGIYFLVREMTKRQITPILASIIFLIAPIPVFVLPFYGSGLDKDGLMSAISFFTIIYGDGATFLALSLIPFCMIFFQRYLKSAKTLNFSLTTILCTFILLINRTQSLNMLLILVVVALNALLLGQARIKIRRLFFVIIFSVGMASFWYTPDFWAATLAIFENYMLANFKFLFPLPLILSFLGLFFSFVFFGKREGRRLIFISFLLFMAFFAIVSDWIFNFRSFLPYPHRLIPPLYIFFALVVAQAIAAILDKLAVGARFGFGWWSGVKKVGGSLLFGFTSFVFLMISAYFTAPYVVRFVSGSSGIWQKIHSELISESQHSLSIAGGNFKLVEGTARDWQLFLGIALSVIFAVWLAALVIRELVITHENK